MATLVVTHLGAGSDLPNSYSGEVAYLQGLIYLNELGVTLTYGSTGSSPVTVTRPNSEIDRMTSLMALKSAGKVSLAITLSADEIASGLVPSTHSGSAAITYAASVALNFNPSLPTCRTLQLAGNVTLTTTGLLAGGLFYLRITGDGSDRVVTVPAGWKFLAGDAPFQVPAGKVAYLELISFDAADADVVARFTAQP